MKNLKMRTKIAVFILIAFGTLRCQPVHNTDTSNPAELGLIGEGDDAPGGNGDIIALEKTRTAAVSRSNRYLDTVVSCLGTRTAGATAKSVWNENKGSLSEEGSANSITSPMLSAMTKISAEVCLDLINQERGIAAAQRRIFNQIDFGAGPNAVNGAQLQTTIRRLSRSCWGRNETTAERDLLESTTLSAFSGQNGAQQTVDQMVFLCAAMTSSFSTFEM